jgi:hypothetical protein
MRNDAIDVVMKACNHKKHYEPVSGGTAKCVCSLVRELLDE